MDCHHCRNRQTLDLYPRQRYIPTYVHTDIFSSERNPPKQRYNPTFVSTVFNGTEVIPVQDCRHRVRSAKRRGAQAEQEHKSKDKDATRNEEALRCAQCEKFRKNTPQKCKECQAIQRVRKNLWYDQKKEIEWKEMIQCTKHGYARERKIVELSSDPALFSSYYPSKKKELRPASSQPKQPRVLEPQPPPLPPPQIDSDPREKLEKVEGRAAHQPPTQPGEKPLVPQKQSIALKETAIPEEITFKPKKAQVEQKKADTRSATACKSTKPIKKGTGSKLQKCCHLWQNSQTINQRAKCPSFAIVRR